MPDQIPQSKNALITGGSKRVGRAMALDLAAHNWGIAVHYHHSTVDADELVQTIRQSGGKAFAIKADLTDTNDASQLVSRAEESLGQIDMIVNNASIFEHDSADALDMDLWDRHFAIHLKAPAIIAASLADIPAKRDRLIVNMIDQCVWSVTPHNFSYTLSKSALWTATQTMAQTFAAKKIRVNAIAPGPTLKNARQSDADFAAQSKAVLLGSGPDLAEFGATLRYLFEAKSITGQMIALDGGQHLTWRTPDIVADNEL